MALYVNTNVSSLNSQRQLAKSTRSLDTSYQRLASGLRINSAKDDAAGLQISDRLTTQINGLNQGNRNAQDGISYAQTAEGAMDEITTMFQRIRTLALQSANGTNSAEDRKAIQQEVTQLCSEVDRIASDTTFGGQHILNGEMELTYDGGFKAVKGSDLGKKHVDFQVGADAYQTIGITLGYEVTVADGDGANNKINAGFGMLGLAVVSKNKVPATPTAFGAADVAATADAATAQTFIKNGNSVAFNVSTADGAQAVLKNLDQFIEKIDGKRAELGAVENRLESTIRNQSNVSENLSDARSQIRDTDFATETANMTQTSILQQASQAILSQANQRPQLAMSLLQG